VTVALWLLTCLDVSIADESCLCVWVCVCVAGAAGVSVPQVENSMRAATSILQGSFDPIMDAANNLDLLPLIIQAKVGWGRALPWVGGGGLQLMDEVGWASWAELS
jgi:hypothetical protein